MTREPKVKEKRWKHELELPLVEEFRKTSFEFNPRSKKPAFVIDTPPPYPSGKWHIGAVAHYALIDMIARSQRMLGFNVLFPWGVDRNGINIELVVEKKYKRALHDWNREDFIKICKREIDVLTEDLEKIARRVGLSCSFEHAYHTDSPEYRAASQAAFIELWKKGLIVEELRPNNYCPACRTTIADAEVYYADEETRLVYILWETEMGEKLTISTTRPELMCTCQVVLVHPEDPRYRHLHGTGVKIPIYGRLVPIRAHPYVDPKFGSGAMMICSYGDSGDVRLFRELRLEPINAIEMNGKMTEAAGSYKGLVVKEARQRIVEDLKRSGLVTKEEKTVHKVPFCERSQTPIEIINMKEWYVRQTDVLDALRKRAQEMRFHPERHRQLLLDWIDTITIDWPVSRRRYYHTEIPVWYCKACGHAQVPEPGRYYRPWKDKPPFARCEKCGGSAFEGEERVFDTWMDSSISNLYVAGYPRANEKLFPVTLRPQGRDIVRTWLFYTLLKSHLLKDSRPFEHVWITGMGLDERGRKMSKSLGNIVDPDDVLARYGADAFRLWAASETSIGDDFRVSEERIEGAYKFLVKLWNVVRFVSQFETPEKRPKPQPLDEWILHELNTLVKASREAYEEFDLHAPAVTLRHFVWEVFASHYLELVKPRAYNQDGGFTKEEQEAALWTLNYVLNATLKLLAPITPFITYKLFKELQGKNVHEEELPESLKGVRTPTFTTQHVIDTNRAVWKHKKDRGLSLKTPLEKATLPKPLQQIEKDLRAAHGLRAVEWGGTVAL